MHGCHIQPGSPPPHTVEGRTYVGQRTNPKSLTCRLYRLWHRVKVDSGIGSPMVHVLGFDIRGGYSQLRHRVPYTMFFIGFGLWMQQSLAVCGGVEPGSIWHPYSLKQCSGSGTISQRYGSADPDPHQNVMDPEHCLKLPSVPHLFRSFSVLISNLRQVTVNGTPKKPRILRKNKDDVTAEELQQVRITMMSSLFKI